MVVKEKLIEPASWTKIKDNAELLQRQKEYGLCPQRAKKPVELSYYGFASDDPVKCSLVGYTEKFTPVIEIDGCLHCIEADLLKFAQIPECERNFVAIDTETTGFGRDAEIIEISAIRYSYGQVCDRWATLVQPEAEIPAMITRLTGIKNEDVENAPKIDDIKEIFLDFIKDSAIVGHNVKSFDIPKIESAFGVNLKNEIIDTLQLSRKTLPNLKSHKLQLLREYFAIETDTAHRADADAEVTAEIYLKLLLMKRGIKFQPFGEAENSDESADCSECDIPLFDLLRQAFFDCLEANFAKKDMLRIELKQAYYSVFVFYKNTAYPFLRFGKNSDWFSVANAYMNLFDKSDIDIIYTSGWFKICLSTINRIKKYAEPLTAVLQKTLDRLPTEFDCCSRYEQCSDKKCCVHPNYDMRFGCYYRKNLRDGRIFYGKNSIFREDHAEEISPRDIGEIL